MKSPNKQTNIYIYTYVSPQESYTGRTAKKMYVTRKEKYTCVIPEKQVIHVQSQRMNSITRVLILQRILEVFLFIPIHCIFWRFLIRVSFPLDYVWVPFCFFSTKNAGHWAGIVEIKWWPQATTYSANFSWLVQWAALIPVNLCTHATDHLVVFSPPSNW